MGKMLIRKKKNSETVIAKEAAGNSAAMPRLSRPFWTITFGHMPTVAKWHTYLPELSVRKDRAGGVVLCWGLRGSWLKRGAVVDLGVDVWEICWSSIKLFPNWDWLDGWTRRKSGWFELCGLGKLNCPVWTLLKSVSPYCQCVQILLTIH